MLLGASDSLIASTAEELVRLSEEMQRSVGRFKIADGRAGLVEKK